MVREKEDKILEILRSQGMVSSQIAVNNIREEDQVLEAAYKQFCGELLQIGVTEDLILPKYKVLGILKSRVKATSRQSDGGNIGDKGKLYGSLVIYLQLLTYKQLVTLVQRLCLPLGRALNFG